MGFRLEYFDDFCNRQHNLGLNALWLIFNILILALRSH
jgi:hypothetical protein